MIANIAYNSTNPDVGLEMNLDDSLFKCYLLDTGLLLTQAMSGTRDVDGRLLRGVLYDKLGVNEGMFFENYVAQSLMSRGYDLLFHSRSNPRVEIDFLIRNGIKVCPIEVKSSGYRVHASLDWLLARHPSNLGAKYVVCTGDYEVDNGITSLPFYMTHCL